MTFTAIPAGTDPWDQVLNNGILDVQSQAVAAQGTANTAVSNAATAQTTANTAVTNAAAAQNTANTAVTNAAAAQATASAAVPKDAQVWNVKDHGATGNGSTDDTAAIQSAINLATSGGIIYFPPGSYLLNGSSSLTLSNAGVLLVGAGAENTKILIGASFTATAAIASTGYNNQVRDLSVSGANSTTTSNPVANGVEITGVRRNKVINCFFGNINGWAIEAVATSANGTSNPVGTLIDSCYFNANAGNIHFLGNTTQTWAMNSQVIGCQGYNTGVTTGASANLDAICIEDAWDVLLTNNIMWTSVGTGSSLHIKGTCAASFIKDFDGLGPNTGSCVLIEDSANGSPQNTQIDGGVVQQGNIGLNITGGAVNVHVTKVRVINNQTHGIQVASTGSPVQFNDVFVQLSGQGATGTNYDVNWSGSATGYMMGCWLGSSVVSTGVAGVQNPVNITAAQHVNFINANFAGSGATSSNYFTSIPSGVMEISSGSIDFMTQVLMKNSMAFQPSSLSNTILSSNLNGSQPNNNFVIAGDGSLHWGAGGGSARDTNLYRAGVGLVQTDETFKAAQGIVPATTGFSAFGAGGGINFLNTTSGASVTMVAGTIYWAQVYIPTNTTLTGVMVDVGTTGGTDLWIGSLYSSTGTLVANSSLSGTTAGSANTKMKLPFTGSASVMGPGTYYIALQSNGTTAKFLAFSNNSEGFVTGSQTGAFGTLPSITPGTTYTQNVGPFSNTY